MFKKSVKKILAESPNVFPDKIVCRQDGSIEVKSHYFYRHGQDAQGWAEKVKNELEANGLKVNAKGRDDWAAWPKDSYFVAVIKEA